jgi:anti-anti-sigma factor
MRAVNENLQQPDIDRPAGPVNTRHPPIPAVLRLEFEGGEGMPLRAAVHGEIDYAGAFSMQVRIAAACRRRRARGLILDLSGAEFMSSSGLAAILNLQREAAGINRRLLIVDTCEEAEILLLYSAAGADVSPSLPRDPSFN